MEYISVSQQVPTICHIHLYNVYKCVCSCQDNVWSQFILDKHIRMQKQGLFTEKRKFLSLTLNQILFIHFIQLTHYISCLFLLLTWCVHNKNAHNMDFNIKSLSFSRHWVSINFFKRNMKSHVYVQTQHFIKCPTSPLSKLLYIFVVCL